MTEKSSSKSTPFYRTATEGSTALTTDLIRPTTEKPILFSGEMIRAILDGRKTQTRRVGDMRGADRVYWHVGETHAWKGRPPQHYEGWVAEVNSLNGLLLPLRCPYGKPGDRLWVRETHALVPRTAYARSDGVQQTLNPSDDHDAAIYREGWERSHGGLRWRPSIHMPRWASRITLEITGVRVERIQDISGQDAIAEGIRRQGDYYLGGPHRHVEGKTKVYTLAWQAYKDIWNHLNERRGYSWDSNPWVWVIGFRVVFRGERRE